MHGSLKATEVRALIEKKEEEEQQKKVRKEELELRKAESKEQFLRCREACVCKAGVCRAMGLQQCSVCKNVQKSQCIKKACKVDGLTPVMVYVAARKDKVKKKRKRCEDDEGNDEEEGDEEDENEDKESFDDSEQDDEEPEEDLLLKDENESEV